MKLTLTDLAKVQGTMASRLGKPIVGAVTSYKMLDGLEKEFPTRYSGGMTETVFGINIKPLAGLPDNCFLVFETSASMRVFLSWVDAYESAGFSPIESCRLAMEISQRLGVLK